MRTPRIKEEGAGYYHVISRVVDRRMVFDREEKERFRRTLRAMEAFSDCDVLTYCALDNHFHCLLYVPERKPVTVQSQTHAGGAHNERKLADGGKREITGDELVSQ